MAGHSVLLRNEASLGTKTRGSQHIPSCIIQHDLMEDFDLEKKQRISQSISESMEVHRAYCPHPQGGIQWEPYKKKAELYQGKKPKRAACFCLHACQ